MEMTARGSGLRWLTCVGLLIVMVTACAAPIETGRAAPVSEKPVYDEAPDVCMLLSRDTIDALVGPQATPRYGGANSCEWMRRLPPKESLPPGPRPPLSTRNLDVRVYPDYIFETGNVPAQMRASLDEDRQRYGGDARVEDGPANFGPGAFWEVRTADSDGIGVYLNFAIRNLRVRIGYTGTEDNITPNQRSIPEAQAKAGARRVGEEVIRELG